MATVTPNYNWPVPQSTDFVKDGADAIKDLGDAIDATVFGLPSGGLTLISTTTFSAVASQSVNDVFSATYENYVLIMSLTQTNDTVLNFRYRVGGADNTTTNYGYHLQILSTGAATYSAFNGNSVAQIFIASSNGSTNSKSINLTTFRPFATAYTGIIGNSNASAGNGAMSYVGGAMQGAFAATTSFTGFSIFPNAGTISGTIRVYGVQD